MAVESPLPAGWPAPDAAAAVTSRRLTERIEAAIAGAGGALGFDRFMAMALYEPGLGYYSAGARKFGEGGDFVTAPEISPVFSHCLATQCIEALAALDGGQVLEAGAGSGVMAADMLTAMARADALPERYRILEVSADLRQRQRETLARRCPDLLPRVDWLDTPPAQPWSGVLVANEVADAIPVHRFEIGASQVLEIVVTATAAGLALDTRPAGGALAGAVAAIERSLDRPLPTGYRGEVCLALPGWLEAVAGGLDTGLVLTVDYGLPRRELYLEERREGTLICHYRHRVHADPLLLPGLQDMTAWVDFTALAEAAVALDFEVAGFATQAHFLLGCGLEQRVGDLMASSRNAVRVSSQVKRLMLPGEMGERFKVLGLTRGLDAPLRGFAVRDLAATL